MTNRRNENGKRSGNVFDDSDEFVDAVPTVALSGEPPSMRSGGENRHMGTTLKKLAASGDPASRGAAALIESGYADTTSVEELRPGSVTRTLAEAFARELANVHERLGEVYESAFLDTATGESVEVLVDGLRPRRAWWRRRIC